MEEGRGAVDGWMAECTCGVGGDERRREDGVRLGGMVVQLEREEKKKE